MAVIILETERLVVRQIEYTDLNRLNFICSDTELMKYVGDGKPLSKDQVKKWVEVTIINYAEKGFGNYAVVDKETNEVIGYCGLVFSIAINEIELIYALIKDYWNKGIGTEVAKAVLDYGLHTIKLKVIYASIDPENIPSQKILERIGFQFAFEQNDEFGLSSLYYKIM
ncbi:GNAT family N-acetyltransferase [Pedobacter sp. B4-66]|uniref:GNAT family N-acetyltransferase n=1 Tax=Pedobacter sp. B4-66 TaxID=2817280 RepID=UPI001BDA1202|nr:GNAT family N-acetyltransferase [Pedobacter sp. B4-66]